MKIAVLFTATVVTCALPALVWAAPAPSCRAATMTPGPADGFDVPANIPGFAYSATAATTADVHLYALSGTAKNEVALVVGPPETGRVKVAPASTLTPGTSYELDWEPFCNEAPYPTQMTFRASAAAPLPTQLGDAERPPRVTVSPYAQSSFTLEIAYSFADEMKPWAGLFTYALVIDGKDISSQVTSVTPTTVTLVANSMCDFIAVDSSQHTVAMRATMPYAGELATHETHAFFDCPHSTSPIPANGSTSSSGGGAASNGNETSSCAMSGAGAAATAARARASTGALASLGALAVALMRRVRRRLARDASAVARRT